MIATSITPDATPAEICGCCIQRVLTADQSYLAVGPGGRTVVLKKIDPDCLIGKSLHPVVRDRLTRVRELAHASVANLFGVEREGENAYLMWEYADGVRLDFYAEADHSLREVAAVMRELVLAVDLLHMQGIVHGALIGSNVIVTAGKAVRLTHISPLIYTDPAVDIECVMNLLDLAAEQLGEQGVSLAALANEARQSHMSLRDLGRRLGALIDTRDAKRSVTPEPEAPSGPRRRALLGAALATGLGLALAGSAWYAIQTGKIPLPDTLQHPFHNPADR